MIQSYYTHDTSKFYLLHKIVAENTCQGIIRVVLRKEKKDT